jgi:periplasmic divalent cation tolerance protein
VSPQPSKGGESEARDVDILLVNAPPDRARAIARALVERRLAACVNILPGVTSIYRWEGKIEEAAESMLFIKTRRELVAEVTAAVRALHPYAVPEIVAVPLASDRGNAAYLDWVYAETATDVQG